MLSTNCTCCPCCCSPSFLLIVLHVQRSTHWFDDLTAEMSPEEPVCLFVFKEGQREGGRTEPSAQGLVGLSLALRGGLPWWVGSRLDGSVPPRRCVQEGVPRKGNFWKKGCALESMFLWLGSGIAGGNETKKRAPVALGDVKLL